MSPPPPDFGSLLVSAIADQVAERLRPELEALGKRMAGDSGVARPKLYTHKEAAALLRVQPQTLAAWRSQGKGPAFLKIGPQQVCYRSEDVEDWLQSCRRASTADQSD